MLWPRSGVPVLRLGQHLRMYRAVVDGNAHYVDKAESEAYGESCEFAEAFRGICGAERPRT